MKIKIIHLELNHFLDIPYELLIPPVEALNDFVYTTKVK